MTTNGDPVVLSISLLVLFGLFLAVLMKFKAVGPGSAFVGVMFGYYLAASPASPAIDELMASLGHFVSSF
ncbi:hypothetical protein ACJ6WF_21075 [Streptomyces sp. MMS24-I2-30]|uniref:hypothetical protein n=1 Tax=Streptomyces sp. MMS24-I2-30 TaxID=3351564 RepID=UPI003896C62F